MGGAYIVSLLGAEVMLEQNFLRGFRTIYEPPDHAIKSVKAIRSLGMYWAEPWFISQHNLPLRTYNNPWAAPTPESVGKELGVRRRRSVLTNDAFLASIQPGIYTVANLSDRLQNS